MFNKKRMMLRVVNVIIILMWAIYLIYPVDVYNSIYDNDLKWSIVFFTTFGWCSSLIVSKVIIEKCLMGTHSYYKGLAVIQKVNSVLSYIVDYWLMMLWGLFIIQEAFYGDYFIYTPPIALFFTLIMYIGLAIAIYNTYQNIYKAIN